MRVYGVGMVLPRKIAYLGAISAPPRRCEGDVVRSGSEMIHNKQKHRLFYREISRYKTVVQEPLRHAPVTVTSPGASTLPPSGALARSVHADRPTLSHAGWHESARADRPTRVSLARALKATRASPTDRPAARSAAKAPPTGRLSVKPDSRVGRPDRPTEFGTIRGRSH